MADLRFVLCATGDEKDPEKAKTHHRKVQPKEKNWEDTVLVWPLLLKMEFLVAILVYKLFSGNRNKSFPPYGDVEQGMTMMKME